MQVVSRDVIEHLSHTRVIFQDPSETTPTVRPKFWGQRPGAFAQFRHVTAVGSVQPGPMPADTEVRIGRFAELIATALVAGHRDAQQRQLLAEGSRRLNLIDSLLEGRAFDEWSLREVASYLRLPITGPFVVVAAHVPAGGDEPLPGIESKLRSLDIFSAWQLLPGSSTSSPTENSTWLLPCCRG
jgi:hypothetical protein